MIDNPSYQDFATHDDSEYPELWDGCVGAWAPCLGPSGSRLHDHSGRQNWGTLTNMDAATDWAVDGGKYALDFDGSNDFILLPNAIGQPQFFTVSHWIFLAGSQSVKTIFGNFFNQTGWVTGIRDDAQNRIKFFLGNGVALQSPTLLATRTWHHVAVTYSPARPVIYINGGLDSVSGQSITYGQNSTENRIGDLSNQGNQNFNGLIDDVAVYNRVLSLSEIRLLASRRGIAYTPRRRRKAYFAQRFNAAWARGSNVILQPSVGVA